MRRPTAPLVISITALAVASFGTAHAAGLIDGRTIRPNTVTGRQVNEATLRGVDAAKVAGGAVVQRHLRVGRSLTTRRIVSIVGLGSLDVFCAPGPATTGDVSFKAADAVA